MSERPRSGLYIVQFNHVSHPGDPTNGVFSAEYVQGAARSKSDTQSHAEGGSKKEGTSTKTKAGVSKTTAKSSEKGEKGGEEGVSDFDKIHMLGKEVAAEKLKVSVTDYSAWYLLCQLNFEGDGMGSISGTASVRIPSTATQFVQFDYDPFAPISGLDGYTETAEPPYSAPGECTEECKVSASPSQRYTTNSGNSSYAEFFESAKCAILPGSHWSGDEQCLQIYVERMDASIAGGRGILWDVVLSLSTTLSIGSCVGDWYVASYAGSENESKLANPLPDCFGLRFLLKKNNRPRCCYCFDPIGISCRTDVSRGVSVTPPTCQSCHLAQYCSKACHDKHKSPNSVGSNHDSICPALQSFGGEGYRTVASLRGRRFTVYWKCLEEGESVIVIDQNNPLHVAYEISLNLFDDARDGFAYRLLPTEEMIIDNEKVAVSAPVAVERTSSKIDGTAARELDDFDVDISDLSVFGPEEFIYATNAAVIAVARHSREEGALMLTATCLNHLFVYSPYIESIVMEFYHFYEDCIKDQLSSDCSISSLAEFIMFVRPLYELSVLYCEWALKSPLANSFWRRLTVAKTVLVSLYNFNAALQFEDALSEYKAELLADQQRQTLLQLARTYLLMASRAPKANSEKFLTKAEGCIRDAISICEREGKHKEVSEMWFRLAAITRLYSDESRKQRAMDFVNKGKLEAEKIAAQVTG